MSRRAESDESCRCRRAVLGVANQVWANEVVMDYLREGRYEYSTPIPGQGNIKYVVSRRHPQSNGMANMASMTRRLTSFACCEVHDLLGGYGCRSQTASQGTTSLGSTTMPGAPANHCCAKCFANEHSMPAKDFVLGLCCRGHPRGFRG